MAGDLSEFLDFMPDTVTIYAWVSQSDTGKPTYSPTGTDYRARIELKNRRIVNSSGQEIIARGRVFLGTSAVISVKDKIVLPSEYVPTSPPILAVDISPDETGNHHTVVMIQ